MGLEKGGTIGWFQHTGDEQLSGHSEVSSEDSLGACCVDPKQPEERMHSKVGSFVLLCSSQDTLAQLMWICMGKESSGQAYVWGIRNSPGNYCLWLVLRIQAPPRPDQKLSPAGMRHESNPHPTP